MFHPTGECVTRDDENWGAILGLAAMASPLWPALGATRHGSRTVWRRPHNDEQASADRFIARKARLPRRHALTGGKSSPPLTAAHSARIGTASLWGTCFDRIRKTMPRRSGLLTRNRTQTFWPSGCSVNKFPAGKTSLPAVGDAARRFDSS